MSPPSLFSHCGPLLCKAPIAFLLLLAMTLSLVESAQAQSIVINDCKGFTRAIQNVGVGEFLAVQVEVIGARDPSRIRLQNDVDGATFSGTLSGNFIVFSRIPSGLYTIVADDKDVLLGVIRFSPAVSPSVLGAAGAGVGALGVAGVVGLVAAIDDGSDGGDSKEPLPPPPLVPTTPLPPVVTPRPTPCPECDPDATPEPIDDFFRKKQEALESAQQMTILSPYH